MMVLQTVSHTRAEACPPPCVNTTNKLQPFGHRRGIKTSTRPVRFAQLVDPVLPLLRARGGVLELIWETVIWDMLTRASTPPSRATAAMVTVAVSYPADTDMPK